MLSSLPSDLSSLPFLIYRLPGQKQPVCYFFKHLQLISEGDLLPESGFVFFPFDGQKTKGIFLSGLSETLPETSEDGGYSALTIPPQPATRHEDFFGFVEAGKKSFDSGFIKTVAARVSNYSLENIPDPKHIAQQAAESYPDACICILNIPGAFTWFCCTPELLFQKNGRLLETMSLAGTRPDAAGEPRWSEKEVEEQQIVSDFLKTRLVEMGGTIQEVNGPASYFTGSLHHLRTNLRALVPESLTTSAVCSKLHPTPAVCGFPADEAFKFICEHEQLNRGYYTGYFGMKCREDATYFVNLRSGYVAGNRLTLFTGCGITKGSDAEAEWQETGIKRNTVLNLFKIYNPVEIE